MEPSSVTVLPGSTHIYYINITDIYINHQSQSNEYLLAALEMLFLALNIPMASQS